MKYTYKNVKHFVLTDMQIIQSYSALLLIEDQMMSINTTMETIMISFIIYLFATITETVNIVSFAKN